MLPFNVGVLGQVYYRLMEKELDPYHTKHLSLTCQHLYSLWQLAPPDVWKSICERIFPQIFMPSQSTEYRQYYQENCNGRYLAKHVNKIVCLQTQEHPGQISGLCLSKHRNILFSSAGKTIRLWNTYTMECIDTWQCRGTVGCMTINSEYLFVGFAGPLEYNIKAWSIEKWREIGGRGNAIDRYPETRKLEGHNKIIKCLDSVGNRVVSGSVGKTIKVWDANQFLCLHTIFTKGYIVNVKIAEEKIISLVDNVWEGRYLKIWDLETGGHLHNVKLATGGHLHSVAGWCNTFAYEQESKTLLTGFTELSHFTIEMLMKTDCILTDSGATSPNAAQVTCLYMTKQLDIVTYNCCAIQAIERETYKLFKFTGCDDMVVALCESRNRIFSGSQRGLIQFWGIPSKTNPLSLQQSAIFSKSSPLEREPLI
jgi:WD40 repeat protein